MKHALATIAFVMTALSAGAETLRLPVEDAQPSFDQRGQPAINLTLTREAASQLGRFTAARVDQQVELTVDGVVVMTPVIKAPISAGGLQISGPLGQSDDYLPLIIRLRSGEAVLELRDPQH